MMKFLTGDNLMKVLIAQYLFVALAFAWEKDWPKTGYFLSAAGISFCVLWMK